MAIDVLVWLLPPFVLTIGLLTAGHALLNKRDPKAAFGWIALCIILPLAGPILYYLFGINRVRSRARKGYDSKLNRDALTTLNDPPGTFFRPLSTIGETLTGKGLSACTQLDLLENGEALYPAMIKAINTAQNRILLASYIFDHNNSGLQIADALAAAVARGVEVKVIVDGLGEMMYLPRIGEALRSRNIEFARFNPLRLFPPSLNINMRSHRKLLIIDGTHAFTGGQNIGDRHLADNESNPDRVLDMHFCLQGKIVDDLEWAFWKDWYFCTNTKPTTPFMGSNANDENAKIWSRLILDGPHKRIDKLNNLILGVISAARSRVLIMTPYFLPTFDIIGALIAAQLRGVQVQILLPGHNNIAAAHWAMQNTLRQLLEAGLDIRYQPAPFVHSKLLLIDECYTLIGSANIDPRSLRLNYELAVELFSTDASASISAYYEKKAAQAISVTLDDLNSRSLPRRLRDSLAWLFSPYL